jgi:hypothetical protein
VANKGRKTIKQFNGQILENFYRERIERIILKQFDR